MQVTVIGPGYVGLPTSVVLAGLGHHVFLLGNIPEQIGRLKQGDTHLHEPGLNEPFREHVEAGRIVPTTSYAESIPTSEVVIIAVGTPSGTYGEADMKHVFAAAAELATHLDGNTIVVTKSTVPVGTAERLASHITQHKSKDSAIFEMASCPEFLREGTALADAHTPDRIVIGVTSDVARDTLLKLHEGLSGERVVTDPKSAELIKYASNAFLATKISFINEIANICEGCDADVSEVARGMGLDSRIGPKFLRAGLGWSGSCFPKDVRALHHIAFSNNYDTKILKAAIEVNNDQRARFVRRVEDALNGLSGKTIAVLGLAFKPNTDDARESAALDLLYLLKQKGAFVRMHDPVARPDARDIFTDVAFSDDLHTTVRDVDAIMIATEWPEYKETDWKVVRNLVRNPLMADGRNLLEPKQMRDAGWRYMSIGRA